MNTKESQVYAKLLSVASLIHCYGIGDDLYFYEKFPEIDRQILSDIWELSSQKEKIIDNYSQLSDEELTRVQFELKYFRHNNAKTIEYLSKPLRKYSVNLKVECELRRQLATDYIGSAIFAIENKLGVPESFIAPSIRKRRRSVQRIFIVSIILLAIVWLSLPRLTEGLTPVDRLARKYFEESRLKFSGAICRDGWISHSQGRGTCSHHGGVFRYFEEGEHTKSFDECLKLAKEKSWLE